MSELDEKIAAAVAEHLQELRLDASELLAAARTSARLSWMAGEVTRPLSFQAEPSDWAKARRDWQAGGGR